MAGSEVIISTTYLVSSQPSFLNSVMAYCEIKCIYWVEENVFSFEPRSQRYLGQDVPCFSFNLEVNNGISPCGADIHHCNWNSQITRLCHKPGQRTIVKTVAQYLASNLYPEKTKRLLPTTSRASDCSTCLLTDSTLGLGTLSPKKTT